MNPSRSSIEQALSAHGLRLRGGWQPGAADALPPLPHGRPAAVVWMIGQVGSEVWAPFAASRFSRDGLPDPMDRWSKSIGHPLAEALGGCAVFPSDGPPWWPFQQWAARVEPLQTSPLLLQIHPQFGLWHAWRFALLSPVLSSQDAEDLTANKPTIADLCLSCDGQPCLTACPVQAFSPVGYDVDRCAGFLHGPKGDDCMHSGCQARHACPVAVGYRYRPQHAAFHMAAFAQRRAPGTTGAPEPL